MRQHWSALEAVTGGAYEKANIYDIYSDGSFEAKDKMMQVVAHSTFCERSLCAPNHSVMLHVNDKSGNTMITVQRPGWGAGKYCIGTCPACMDCCQDGIIVHDGRVEAKATCCNLGFCCCDGFGQAVQNPNPISKASVPFLGGGLTPTIDVYEDAHSINPNGVLTGPMCFGGCTELCCESKFVYKAKDGRDVGRVRKLVPTSCSQICSECCTDSDKYNIEFYDKSSAEEKANMMSLTLLADYMFFERDQGIITCTTEDDKPVFKCTMCLMWCCGEITPCNCYLKQGSAQAGEGGAPHAPGSEYSTGDEWLDNYVRDRNMKRN